MAVRCRVCWCWPSFEREAVPRKDMPAVLACLRKIHAQQDLDSFASGMVSALGDVISSDITGYRELDSSGRTIQVHFDLPEAASDAFEERVRAHIHQHPVLR